MTSIRPLALAAALAAGTALGGTGLGEAAAQAQSQCGASYQIQPGDTLYRVAQQCRVTLSRIMGLNPSIDARDLSVGADIRLQARDGSAGNTGGRAGGAGQGYRVEQGDTMFSIAQALGVSLFELMNANEGVNPFALAVGELLDVPDRDEPGASVSIEPLSGTTGATVALHARNLRPDDWVTIGVGPQASEWRRVRDVQVGSDGALSARVGVPDWADPGDDLIFVVDTDRGMTFKSGVFDVVARDEGGGDGDRLSLEGRVRQGTECPVLRTPDGDSWSLVSDDVDFTPGEYVEVEGRRAEVSQCMQGLGTIDVSSIDEVPPPEDGTGERTVLEGRVGRGAECYTLETPDGDIWSLTSSDVAFTEGEYVEVTGQRAEMSFCMQGVGTLAVSEIEEVEPPARDRDPARAGGVRLTDDYMAGAWVAKGGDCDRPDFDVTADGAGRLSVETSLGGSPRTGRVRLGDDPAFVFDQPTRALALESRGPDGVAVMPPADSADDVIRLGGRRIEGDGRVFVRCG